MQQQSYDGAEKYLRRAVAYLATCQKKLDSDYVFHLKAQLALVLVKQQKCKEAETLSRNMLQDSEEEHGKDHHNIACAADLLGKALYHQQQYKEALDLFERAHALVQIEIGDDAPDTKDFLQDCLLAREALAREAEALAKSAKRAEPIPASKKAPTIAVIPTHNWSARKATSGFKAELKSSLYRYLQPKPMIYQRPKSSASCRSFQHSNLNYQLSAPELPLVG
jgi:tetratricopeptide (TPR) repeat protein